MESIYGYFTDNIIKRIIPDVKRIVNKRGSAVLLFSEIIGQIVYIRNSQRKQSLKKAMMKEYHERSIREIKRLMIKKFGRKMGNKFFIESDKLVVLITDKICKNVYRFLWKFNKLGDKNPINPEVYNKKTFHMVFERRKKQEKEIAAKIYESLYKKISNHLECIEEGLRKKDKGNIIKPFNELKSTIECMKYSSIKLQSKYYELTGYRIPYVNYELSKQFDNEVNQIKNAKIIKPTNQDNQDFESNKYNFRNQYG